MSVYASNARLFPPLHHSPATDSDRVKEMGVQCATVLVVVVVAPYYHSLGIPPPPPLLDAAVQCALHNIIMEYYATTIDGNLQFTTISAYLSVWLWWATRRRSIKMDGWMGSSRNGNCCKTHLPFPRYHFLFFSSSAHSNGVSYIEVRRSADDASTSTAIRTLLLLLCTISAQWWDVWRSSICFIYDLHPIVSHQPTYTAQPIGGLSL